MLFIVEAGELIFITYFRSSGSKPFIVEAGELIKIRYNTDMLTHTDRSVPGIGIGMNTRYRSNPNLQKV